MRNCKETCELFRECHSECPDILYVNGYEICGCEDLGCKDCPRGDN